ncbi:DUF1214 domain-containing protein [Rhodovulum sp.]|uniref:DUF1214 domain-containing protein n=1 Tax=Rhodovulum sp. TaxID=34009 RepID=UPI00257F5253|nr:DUF1214 domain-containing protein [Rhodovulum sp.]
MSSPTHPTYKTRNWPSYNEALKRRGSLTIWFDPAVPWEAALTGKRGRQPAYGDAAITLYIQATSPGSDKESNWLPANDGPLWTAMRIYWPKEAALDGTWTQPPLIRMEVMGGRLRRRLPVPIATGRGHPRRRHLRLLHGHRRDPRDGAEGGRARLAIRLDGA